MISSFFFKDKVSSIPVTSVISFFATSSSFLLHSQLCRPLNVDSGYTTPTLAHPPLDNNKNNINSLLQGRGKTERAKISCTGTLQKVKRVYL